MGETLPITAGIQATNSVSSSRELVREFCSNLINYLSSIAEEEEDVADNHWAPPRYPRFSGRPEDFRAFSQEWRRCDYRMCPPTTAEEARHALITECLPSHVARMLDGQASLGDVWIQLNRLYGPNNAEGVGHSPTKKKRARKRGKLSAISRPSGLKTGQAAGAAAVRHVKVELQPFVGNMTRSQFCNSSDTGDRAGEFHCSEAQVECHEKRLSVRQRQPGAKRKDSRCRIKNGSGRKGDKVPNPQIPEKENVVGTDLTVVPPAPPVQSASGRKDVRLKDRGHAVVSTNCLAKCRQNESHDLTNCDTFLTLPNGTKWKIIRRNRLCHVCYSSAQKSGRCADHQEEKQLVSCSGEAHTEEEGRKWVNANPVMLQAQEINLSDGSLCVALFDTGSQITLITEYFAKLNKLDRIGDSKIVVHGIGEREVLPGGKYEVPLRKRNGDVLRVVAHGVDRIVSALPMIDWEAIGDKFALIPESQVTFPTGHVDMLVGLDNAYIHPIEVHRTGGVILYLSQFGEKYPWILAGNLGGQMAP